jgi:hypothetical protein
MRTSWSRCSNGTLGRRPRGPAEVNRLVLAALAGRREDAMLVLGPDLGVAYYNAAAAAALELSFPPDPAVELELIRERHPAVYRDGTPRPVETRPLAVALAERRPVMDEVCLARPDAIEVFRTRVVPFFADDGRGRLLGAAVYWTRAERLPVPDAS